MNSLQLSSLEHMEDRSSILSKLKDIEKRLIEIEDNTHPDRGNRSNFRHNRQEKVTVDITAIIISIDDIDTISQQFKCDFYLSATWQEPQLQGRSPSEEIKWHKEWHPRIEFFNAVEIKMEKYRDLRYEQEENAIVVESYRIKGTFRQNLNLLNFPLDFQELTITLKSTWTSKQVEFQKDLRKVDRIEPVTFAAEQEWYLCKHVVTETTTQHIGHATEPRESSEHDYPLYLIKCHVKRKSGYYFWNFAMVIFLIYILSICSFSVEISSPADRLSITLTLLLTAVAFKFVVSQSLPTISYMTLLDRYVLSGLVFLCVLAIENAIVAGLIPDPNTQKRFDRICFYVALACVVVLQVVAFAVLIKKWRTRNKELAKSENLFLEMKDRVNKLAKERQKNQQKTHETSV